MNINSTTTVQKLMERYPSVIKVFMKYRLACVGCPAEAFHTLEDVARVYGLALKPFINELCETAVLQKNDE